MNSVSELNANPNSNCLEGKRCPKCGSYGPFEVVASMRILLSDSGTDETEDSAAEFDGDARTTCCVCSHAAKFSDFDE